MELSDTDSDSVSDYCSGSRKRKRSVQRSLEYPCVWRLRQRRLLAFLWRYRFTATFDGLVQETHTFLHIPHLQRLVRLGKWMDAIEYITRIATSTHVLGDEGRVLASFIHTHNVIDCIVDGKPHGANVARQYETYIEKNHTNPYPGIVKLGRILLALLHSEQYRASIDWYLVRVKAAEIVKNLIAQAPEFNDDLLKIPDCPTKPHNILPIATISHRKRHVKKESQIPASDIAQIYLHKKKRLPSLSHCQETSSVGLSHKAGLSHKSAAWLADIIDESVQAGRMLHDGYPFKYSCNEAIPSAPVAQVMYSNLRSPAKSSASHQNQRQCAFFKPSSGAYKS